MIEIKGKYNEAKIFTDVVDSASITGEGRFARPHAVICPATRRKRSSPPKWSRSRSTWRSASNCPAASTISGSSRSAARS